jgi:hypothetical protein
MVGREVLYESLSLDWRDDVGRARICRNGIACFALAKRPSEKGWQDRFHQAIYL